MSGRGLVFLKNIDIFGKQTPQLNIRGQNKIKTHLGGCITLIILIITFLFASLKM